MAAHGWSLQGTDDVDSAVQQWKHVSVARFFRPIMCPICRGACVVRPSMFFIVLQICRRVMSIKGVDWDLNAHVSFHVGIEMPRF